MKATRDWLTWTSENATSAKISVIWCDEFQQPHGVTFAHLLQQWKARSTAARNPHSATNPEGVTSVP